MKQYQENIILNLHSHIHRADVRAPVSSEIENLDLRIFISPSISPVYRNQPSYTLLQLDNQSRTVTGLNSWSFNLQNYRLYQGKRWTEIDWINDFGIDFNDANSMR